MIRTVEYFRLKAIASSERVQLLVCLDSAKSVSELLEQCTLSQSALSQHLKVLRDATFVTAMRDGKRVMYRVSSKKILKLAHAILEVIQE